MGRHTRVVGPAGRFGARYGATLRKKVAAIERKMKARHKCPRCQAVGTVKRESIGIWVCRKCGYKFAGGAWLPRTEAGRTFSPEELKSMGLA